MAEIVNLRLVRKRKARDDKDAAAAANRAKFGRTKAEREVEALKREQADRLLDGHRLDVDGDKSEE